MDIYFALPGWSTWRARDRTSRRWGRRRRKCESKDWVQIIVAAGSVTAGSSCRWSSHVTCFCFMSSCSADTRTVNASPCRNTLAFFLLLLLWFFSCFWSSTLPTWSLQVRRLLSLQRFTLIMTLFSVNFYWNHAVMLRLNHFCTNVKLSNVKFGIFGWNITK